VEDLRNLEGDGFSNCEQTLYEGYGFSRAAQDDN
jgi:hypothetical protein